MSVNLLPLCYWHELPDLVCFYKVTRHMIHLDLHAKDPYIRNELSAIFYA